VLLSNTGDTRLESLINQVKMRLMAMGLNEYQASALAHLMYLGETKATTLSKASKVPSARIYGVLEELSQKGLIIVRPGRPTRYSALSPEEIADALIGASREELRREMALLEDYRGEFEEASRRIYLKAGGREERRGLIRIISVGEVSLEETRKLYRGAQERLFIATRAFEYLGEVKKALGEAVGRGVEVKILMRHPETLRPADAARQQASLKALQEEFGDSISVRYSRKVEIRGCIVDYSAEGKALFLVEEEGVPLFLREAAITFHPGVAKALGSMFLLKWRFDSQELPKVY